jgi:F-box/leucine-rich repeat protein 9
MDALKIHETSLLTKKIFNFMITSMPNLTSLTLQNCFSNMKARDRADILDSIIEFIRKRPEHIRQLNLLNTQTDAVFLEKLAEAENLRLNELRLTFNGVVTTIGKCGILMLIRNQKYLEILDLTDSKGLSNLCLIEICKNMATLKQLILTRCWMINDVGLREVSRLQHLEVLDVTSCDRITDLGLVEGLIPQGKKSFKLKKLYLGLLPYMSILSVYRLSQQYDELQVLDLSGSSNSINDEAIQMIFRYQLKLKHLNLDCCAKITDFGLTGYSEQSDLGNCQNYVSFNLNSLKDLRYLNIAGCYQITDKSLIKCFDLPDLKELNISRCHNCTEAGIDNMTKKCKFIEALDLSECSRHVTDSTIEIVTKNATRLETLKLNGCHQITDDALDIMKRNCKYLKVRKNVNKDFCYPILTLTLSLQSLFIRRCRMIINTNPFEILTNVKYIYNQ